MMIDYLPDEILRDIFCRLPCYRTALVLKAISKRWCSIISDPLFVTQGLLTHREINEDPYSVFLLTLSSSAKSDDKFVSAMVAPPCFQETTLRSPFLSLKFLPFHSKPVTIFKDLILSYSVDPWARFHVYSICNSLTKQWMVLPPSQLHRKQVVWAALTRLDGRGFRVVVAHSFPKAASSAEDPFAMINLLIYISETCQWRNIDVRIQLKPSDYRYNGGNCFKGVVCKGMVCIHYGKYFGAFNPFDVTDTSHGTLTATDLPSPARKVRKLLESDGKLVAFEDHYISLRFNYDGNSAYLSDETRIWKLDMRLNIDKKLPQWKLLSTHHNDRIDVEGSMLTSSDRFRYGLHKFEVVGVHPSKEHLVYLIKAGSSRRQNWLILFDTKSKSLRHLTNTVPPHEFLIATSPKLDIPCWPTPIPIS